LAAQIISRVRREFNVDIPLRAIFEGPTVAQLARHLDSADQSLSHGAIGTVERNGTAPLSFTQQQFWLLDQAATNRAAYNVCTAVKICGPLDVQRLRKALEQIVSRHEVLRTGIVVEQGTPVQMISP